MNTLLAFCCVFAFDGGGPTRSHTWAVFTRGPEVVCISWMPAGGKVKPGPQPGRNWTHEESLSYARSRGYRVWSSGSFPVSETIFLRAVARKRWLDSGAVPYAFLRTNCIWAVSGVAGPLNTGVAWGARASRMVARHLCSSGWRTF